MDWVINTKAINYIHVLDILTYNVKRLINSKFMVQNTTPAEKSLKLTN